MGELLRRLRYLLNRGRFDEELAGDMEFHREMAAREGRRTVGNTLRLREEAREAWGWTWIDRLFQDLRYAMRVLRNSPGFTLAVVLMLAIGIGVNVAAFGFFNLLALRPLPVREPETLLRFQRHSPGNFVSDVPYPAMAFYREHTRTLSAVLALDFAQLVIEGEEKPLKAHFVTGNFFGELGAVAVLGRTLDAARDEAQDAAPVAVLGNEFWKRHFGGDPAIIGATIRLNDRPVTVIGVAGSEFSGLGMMPPDAWLPLTQQPYFVQGSRLLTEFSADRDGVDMWGRMRPGVTPKVIEEELRMLTAELRRLHPNDVWENEKLASQPGGYAQNVGGRERGTSPPKSLQAKALPIFAMVGALSFLILIVSCANLASLLLARGVARQREMAIRTAVGAGSGRLIRQLLTESLVLGLIGAGAGLVLGYVVLRGMMVWTGAPLWLDLTPDWRVMTFAAGMGFAAAVLFGLTPALQLARQRHKAKRSRQFLIGAQVAASCVLLIVAALLVRAVHHAVSGNPGFEYLHAVSIDPHLATHGYSPNESRAYLDELTGRLRSVPGVESVSLAVTPPLGNRKSTVRGEADGRSFDMYLNRIDAEYFQTMKIPLLRGRTFKPGDTQAVMVSESLARRQWPREDPLGKAFAMGDDQFRVVGVTGNARVMALEDADAVEVYLPIETGDLSSLVVLARTSGPVEGVGPSLVSLSRTIDPKVIPEVQTLKGSFRRKLEDAERSAVAVSILGFTALLLACLGIVGLVIYAVSQYTKEIGIRMALGAQPAHVLSIVLSQLSRPIAIGLVAGTGGAAALSQILRKELYGISNLDPVSYLAATGVFVAAAALAAVLPARRALRIDPTKALRFE